MEEAGVSAWSLAQSHCERCHQQWIASEDPKEEGKSQDPHSSEEAGHSSRKAVVLNDFCFTCVCV